MFVLSMLSQGMNILEKTYYVVWLAKEGVARIVWCPCQPKEEGPITFVMDGDVPRDFDCELDAHRYLLDLKGLDQTGDPDAWRRINEGT
jgi:hypothetical protein